MAAHLEGKPVITQDAAGLAQKGGATWSHVQIADDDGALHTTKVGTAEADLVLGCDAIVCAHRSTLDTMHPGRTHVALNTHGVPTAAFVANPDWQYPAAHCDAAIVDAAGAAQVGRIDAVRLARELVGDSIYANPLLLGYAWQRGWVPLSRAALMRAVELNGEQVERNRSAFEWGRRAAHDLAGIQALLAPAQVIELVRRPGLAELVKRRSEFLVDYQDERYAAAYRDFVDKVRAAEAPLKSSRLAEAVAHGLFKLMAYKDEYEVARLHTDRGFHERIAAQFDGDYTLNYHLAPPLLGRKNAAGEPVKQRFGPWMLTAFRVLARMKRLRGTAFDVFGRTAERREERALIEEYRASIDEVVAGLTQDQLALAVEIARIPDEIRGFGHVKARHLAKARPKWAALMAEFRGADAGAATRHAA